MNDRIPILSIANALLLCSCTPIRIAQINSDPLRYRNRTVHVQGIVTESAGAFSFGGYQVSDGTGKIYVLSTRGVPATGAHVTVAGSIVNGVMIVTLASSVHQLQLDCCLGNGRPHFDLKSWAAPGARAA